MDYGREALIGFVGSHGDEPVSTFKIVGTYDALIESGRFVLQERNGLRVLVDLSKQDNTEAIAILEEVLLQLKS